MEKQRITSEKHYEFLKPGDLVRLKGTENDTTQYTMRVERMEWKKDENGKLLRNEMNKKIPIGVRVTCFTDIGEPVEKILHTKSVYKVERTGKYLLLEAKQWFFNREQFEIVKMINQTMDLL